MVKSFHSRARWPRRAGPWRRKSRSIGTAVRVVTIGGCQRPRWPSMGPDGGWLDMVTDSVEPEQPPLRWGRGLHRLPRAVSTCPAAGRTSWTRRRCMLLRTPSSTAHAGLSLLRALSERESLARGHVCGPRYDKFSLHRCGAS